MRKDTEGRRFLAVINGEGVSVSVCVCVCVPVATTEFAAGVGGSSGILKVRRGPFLLDALAHSHHSLSH